MKTLSDEELDVLLKDWFNRDGDTFTKITTKGRIGWEDTLEEGDAYSAYFLEAPTNKDLIERAYSLARDIIVVMNPPKKVSVSLSDTSSFTEGTVVVVATEMFDEKDLSIGERIDTFLGCTVHEGCHLLWTDFYVFKKEMRDFMSGGSRIVKTIFNILEDERVETICGEEKPGLARFLEKTKYYYFDHKFVEEYNPDKELNLFEKILTIFLRVIRYPRYLNVEDFKFFGARLAQIKEILTPYPETTKDTFEAAKKIFEIIKDLYEEKAEETSEGEGDASGEVEEGEETSGVGKEGEPKSTKKDVGKDMMVEAERILTVLEKMLEKASEKGGMASAEVSSSIRGDKDFMDTIRGEVIKGSERETYFSPPRDSKAVYMDSYNRVMRYVPAIRKVVQGHCKEYKLIHKSMRSGILDTTKLAEAYQGVPTVYLREGEVKTDKVAVAVLIDESGSMSGVKIEAARDTAVLLNEALGQIPNVELFIYGHSGDIRTSRSTDLTIYKELRGKHPKYALGSVQARRENRDGTAILEVAKRVRQQTKEHCLLFILSDGAPCASSYHGDLAMRDVKERVLKTERMGFYVIQICIERGYNPALMFKNYLILEDISNLALDLGRAIKQATIKNTKTHIS